MTELPAAQIQRGKRLVILVISIVFAPEVISLILGMIVAVQAYGVLIIPFNFRSDIQCCVEAPPLGILIFPFDFVELFVRLALESILLYCVYRGYSWARWITGILLALGVILGLQEIAPFLPGSPGAVFEFHGIRQTIVALGSIALPLMMIVGFAMGAVIMLASSSVRIFQQAQQTRPSTVSAKMKG